MSDFEKARTLIREFKRDTYLFGENVLEKIGERVARLGTNAALIRGRSEASQKVSWNVKRSLEAAGLKVVGELQGARPNAPREDVVRLASELRQLAPDIIIVLGGGSGIDAAKAAEVLRTLGEGIDDYFGVGQVTEALSSRGGALTPLVAIQLASSSAAHLTKYSNITDLKTGQKKLIVDEAIVPSLAFFQYDVTISMSTGFTTDGAFDGISHSLEVLFGAVGQENYLKVEEVATEGIRLIVENVERAVAEPSDLGAREALGLGTDLGGYSIMIGGTNGGHLTSFSLVDILSHGRACAIMNPYYTVFFAPSIEEPLRKVGAIYQNAGFTSADLDSLVGRDLGLAVANAMMALSNRVGFPTTLGEVPGFTTAHIERALTAAKDPQLKMKLENMPIPLSAEMVDEYMGSVLNAARDGDLSRVKNVV